MGRRKNDSAVGRFSILILFLMGVISCCMVYYSISVVFVPSRTDPTISVLDSSQPVDPEGEEEEEREEFCCRGIEHWELWGDAVKWGSQFKLNSSEECCTACKAMCRKDGPCLCDSWVFCGNQEACGARFGEISESQTLGTLSSAMDPSKQCWLKKQKNSLELDRRDSGDHVMWTSGFFFAEEQGIVGLETEYGTLRLKLFPDCAPRSVAYILELLQLQHSVGFQFYRAESQGSFWDSEGNHVENAPFGPPFALVQGTLEAHGTIFTQIPAEFCPDIRRGSVAWVGSGPDFFISLANHLEWKKAYTVFGSVLPEDIEIVEKISQLPTKLEVWSNINVSVLEKPVTLRFTDHDNLQLQ